MNKIDKFKLSSYYKSKEHLDNAKKGSILGSKKMKKLKDERIKKYLENPNKCKNCGDPLDYEKRHNKFCNNSCAASYNNIKRGKRKEDTKIKISKKLKENYGNPDKIEKICLNCGETMTLSWGKRKQKYCSVDCVRKSKTSDETKEKLSIIMSNIIMIQLNLKRQL